MNSTHVSLMMCIMCFMGLFMFCFLDRVEVIMSQEQHHEPSEEAKKLLAEANAAYHAPDAVAARARMAETAQRQLAQEELENGQLPPGVQGEQLVNQEPVKPFGECPSGGAHHWTTMEGKDSNGTPIRWNACSKCGARG